MFAPMVQGPETSRDMITTFGGYNHNLRIADGLPTSQWGSTPPMEWYDEENLCTDQYPVMSPATMPTVVQQATEGCGCTSFATIDGNEHYAYVNEEYDPETGEFGSTYLYIDNSHTDVELASNGSPRQYVLMGTYLLIFPDHKYININDTTEYGDMDADLYLRSPKLYPCDIDGNKYTGYTTSATAPASPSDGDIWLDTSSTPHVYKKWYASSSMWLSNDVYVRVEETNPASPNVFSNFNEGDGITINIGPLSETSQTLRDQVNALNGSHVIQKLGSDYIVIIGLIDSSATPGTFRLTRTIPDMDYVIECQNRIWGCKFGVVNGKNINEIYCSKLGDFKNWEVYEGLSTDSWRASVGAGGEWTGAVAYNGYPTFFKEDSIHKVYISATGGHQIVMTSADGVAAGSFRSTAIINGVLFYLGHFGVMAYTGTLPTKVSDAIPFVLSDGVGGALNKYYYLSAKGPFGTPVTFVYDTDLRIWHKVSPHHADSYAPVRHRLMYEELIIEDTTTSTFSSRIKEVETRNWDMEEVYGDWYAVSGVIGFAYPDNKYLSRFVFRLDLDKDSWCEMFIEYDSDGQWHSKGRMYRKGLQSFVLPVMPRRCDHCRIKLVGNGNFRLYSISKVLEVGSDY